MIAKRIILILIFYNLIMSSSVLADIKVENFDDFVEKEKRRELLFETESKNESNEFLAAQNRGKIAGRVVAGAITSLWGVFFLYSYKRYFMPHQVNTKDWADIEPLNLIEESAIINLGYFSKNDIIAVIFDLIRRKILLTNDIEKSCAEIYVNPDSNGELTDYEDFLINWLFNKIGKNHQFSIEKLADYMRKSSNCVDFDIDYDIWEDELKEYIKIDILDKETERWKYYNALASVAVAIFGILILYLTNSTYTVVLFIISFLSWRIPKNMTRRTVEGEVMYKKLMNINMEELLKTEIEKDLLLAHSIVLGSTDAVFAVYDKYRELYNTLDLALGEALEKSVQILNQAKSG